MLTTPLLNYLWISLYLEGHIRYTQLCCLQILVLVVISHVCILMLFVLFCLVFPFGYVNWFLIQVKCHQYWPSYGSAMYGNFQVTLRDVENLAEYSVRSFSVQPVTQYSSVKVATYVSYHCYRLLEQLITKMTWGKCDSFISLCGQIMVCPDMAQHCFPSRRELTNFMIARNMVQWWSTAVPVWAGLVHSLPSTLSCRRSNMKEHWTSSTLYAISVIAGTTWFKLR